MPALINLEIIMKIYTDQFLREKILEISEQSFLRILEQKPEWYECFAIPKKDGMRGICALKDSEAGKMVKKMQKNLLNRFLRRIPIAVSAKGFVREESYQSFLEPHAGNCYFMRLDIHDFFGSFSPSLIWQGLQEFVEDATALDRLYELCTWNDVLPQGAVTSPALSNVLFRRVDQRILKYCQTIAERSMNIRRKYDSDETRQRDNRAVQGKLCYTRYADDMLFSSDFFDFSTEKNFIKMISRILKENGFELNRSKTVIGEGQISLNGYMAGATVWLSRNKLRNLKRILYFFNVFKKTDSLDYEVDRQKVQDIFKSMAGLNAFLQEAHYNGKRIGSVVDLINYLAGCRSWLIAVSRMESVSGRTRRHWENLRRRVERLLLEVNKQEEQRGRM